MEGSMKCIEAKWNCLHVPDGKCSNCKNALKIHGNLDQNVVPRVNENAKIVDDFMAVLEGVLKRQNQNEVVILDRVHGGSAFEHLAVEDKADFDITLILEKPYVSTNFRAGRDPSNYFTLKWNNHLREKEFADHDGFLLASQLKSFVFSVLQNALRETELPKGTFTWQTWASSIKVIINLNTGLKISVDLVPQIVFRTWDLGIGLKPLEEMPVSLRDHIKKLIANGSPTMFFALGIPKPEKYQNSDKLFSISFSLLEKKFLKDNTDIRNIVRLLKVVAKRRNWEGNFSFKSFHAKRVALKYCDELRGKVLWEGHQELLRRISQEIGNGTIDGFFVENQVMKKWLPGEIMMFQKEINEVLKMRIENFL